MELTWFKIMLSVSLAHLILTDCPEGEIKAKHENEDLCCRNVTCQPGNYAKPCTPQQKNVLCETCPHGSFRSTPSILDNNNGCQKWRDCSSHPAMYIVLLGNRFNNSRCACLASKGFIISSDGNTCVALYTTTAAAPSEETNTYPNTYAPSSDMHLKDMAEPWVTSPGDGVYMESEGSNPAITASSVAAGIVLLLAITTVVLIIVHKKRRRSGDFALIPTCDNHRSPNVSITSTCPTMAKQLILEEASAGASHNRTALERLYTIIKTVDRDILDDYLRTLLARVQVADRGTNTMELMANWKNRINGVSPARHSRVMDGIHVEWEKLMMQVHVRTLIEVLEEIGWTYIIEMYYTDYGK